MGNLFVTPSLVSYESYELKQIPIVPYDTQIYSCKGNQIEEINNLPENLLQFNCSDNMIKKIERIPQSLKKLSLTHNLIQKIENLPDGLVEFYGNHNKITKVENIPKSISYLYVNFNQITEIENLPDDLIMFNCYGNPIYGTKCKEQTTYKSFTLKSIVADFILHHNMNYDIVPAELKEYLASPTNKCFKCGKSKYIFKKEFKNHKRWEIPCIYSYCYKCSVTKKNKFTYF
jgi:hypothetical protein